jgi:DNA-binding transcriptional ArsR family regulator
MKNDKSLLLEALGDTTELRIIDFLICNTPTEVLKNEIIKRTGISRASFYRVWGKLERFGIVKPVRKIGKFVLYDLNRENKFVEWLLKVDWVLIERAAEEVKIPERIRIVTR